MKVHLVHAVAYGADSGSSNLGLLLLCSGMHVNFPPGCTGLLLDSCPPDGKECDEEEYNAEGGSGVLQ